MKRRRRVEFEATVGRISGHGKRKTIEVGARGDFSGANLNGRVKRPSTEIAVAIRRALRPIPIAPAVIYDAHGRRLGVMDPITRQKTLDASVRHVIPSRP